MHLSPAAIDDMSLRQFGAVVAGWRRANETDDGKPEPMTAERFEQLVREAG